MTLETLEPFKRWFPPVIGIPATATMLLATACYFDLSHEFHKDYLRSPLPVLQGMRIMTMFGGFACLLTALCYWWSLFFWMVIAYGMNSLIVAVFLAFYRRRKYTLIAKYDDESFPQFVQRVYQELNEKGLLGNGLTPPKGV